MSELPNERARSVALTVWSPDQQHQHYLRGPLEMQIPESHSVPPESEAPGVGVGGISQCVLKGLQVIIMRA